VTLRLARGVTLDDVFVRTDVDLDTLDRARLTLQMTLRNHTEETVEAVVLGVIAPGIELEHTSTLQAGETRDIELTPDDYPQLVVDQPRLWWPRGLGEPNLYRLHLVASVDRRVSDVHDVDFGIRHVADYVTEEGYRGYAVNGRRVLIRGGGWVDDLMLADDRRKIEDQIRYVQHMNLNTIRLEGFWGSSHDLYDLADRHGILVMVGWSCQWEWEEYLGGPVDEFGGIDTPEEMALISRSLTDQVRWLRNHPSVLVWVLASDMLPRPELERQYRRELAVADPTPMGPAARIRASRSMVLFEQNRGPGPYHLLLRRSRSASAAWLVSPAACPGRYRWRANWIRHN
jgi:exo-1,4-beta-D-glucosaminidase